MKRGEKVEFRPHARGRPVAVVAAAVLLVAVFGAPALAHVYVETDDEPHPGTEVELRFVFHHGCAGQATTEFTVRMPDGVDPDRLDPVEEDGWDASVEGGTVTWSGGEPVPDHVDHAFHLHLVLPPAPGETIHFPTIQRCGDDEMAWIQIPEEGQTWSEVSEPAPALTLTEQPPPEPAEGTDPSTEETDPPARDTEPAPTPAVDDAEEGEAIVAGDEANPWIIAAAIAGIVVLAAGATGGILLARRGAG